MRLLITVAALLGLALVVSAAMGAHAFFAPGDPALASWERAITFGLIHVVVALLCAALMPVSRWSAVTGWVFIVGVVLFSGVQLARLASAASGGASLDALRMLVPAGGISLMLGWLLLAIAAWRRPRG